MSEQSHPSVPKWPFFLGDVLLLGAAGFIYAQGTLPLSHFALGAICACVALGALLGALPFILEYRIALKLAESTSLTSVVSQIQNLEAIAAQINLATGLWQTVQAHSGKTVSAAKEIGDRMTHEAKAFADFMAKANDAEKGTLRVEVEKLRRAEGDWIQVVIRMLDYTYALHTAALRSGKTMLIEQLTQFQNAQRDAARRVGLAPFTVTPGEPFDATKHQLAQGEKANPGAAVQETLATGFTLRGQLIRPALVALAAPQTAEEITSASAASGGNAPQTTEEPTLL